MQRICESVNVMDMDQYCQNGLDKDLDNCSVHGLIGLVNRTIDQTG